MSKFIKIKTRSDETILLNVDNIVSINKDFCYKGSCIYEIATNSSYKHNSFEVDLENASIIFKAIGVSL